MHRGFRDYGPWADPDPEPEDYYPMPDDEDDRYQLTRFISALPGPVDWCEDFHGERLARWLGLAGSAPAELAAPAAALASAMLDLDVVRPTR